MIKDIKECPEFIIKNLDKARKKSGNKAKAEKVLELNPLKYINADGEVVDFKVVELK